MTPPGPPRYQREPRRPRSCRGARAGTDQTALHTAAQQGHPAVVRELLARGADPLAQSRDGGTPQRWALARNHREAAELLREAEANRPDSSMRSLRLVDEIDETRRFD